MLLVPKPWNFLPHSFLSTSRACNDLFSRVRLWGKGKGLHLEAPILHKLAEYMQALQVFATCLGTLLDEHALDSETNKEQQSQGVKSSAELL